MTDHTELIERITVALENPGDFPWLPDLTSDLVKARWRTLHEETGLSATEYGTSRVVARSVRAPRGVVGYLSASSAELSWASIQVEILDERFADPYADAGTLFYSAEEIRSENLLMTVGDAIHLIEGVPTLSATVAALVRSLHLIKPNNDDYDVSFSEPQIPFSIFVSIPQKRETTDTLRVAEAIVHEAMHLQLTLVERIVPLVSPSRSKYFSPWKGTERSIQGVLHGLYVFRVIDCFLGQVTSVSSPTGDVAEYVRARREEIRRQISEVGTFEGCFGLTGSGSCFVHRLL
jgi:HEXXH motif-containing protein